MGERRIKQPSCGKCGWFVKYIGTKPNKDSDDVVFYQCKKCGELEWLEIDFPENECFDY